MLLPHQNVNADRIMIADDLFALLPADVRAALAPMVEKIQTALGKAASATVFDRPVAEAYDAFRLLQSHEIYRLHGPWIEHRRPVLGAAIAERFVYARNVTDAQVVASRSVRESFTRHLHALYAGGGLMIAPVLHGPAPKLDADAATLDAYRHAAMAFLCPAGMAGLPQLVMPAATIDGGPVGLSILAAPGGDRALLAAAVKIAAV